jgi:hypothetical protein
MRTLHPRHLPKAERNVYLAEYSVRRGTQVETPRARLQTIDLVEEDPLPEAQPEPADVASPPPADAAPLPSPEAQPEPQTPVAGDPTGQPSKVEILGQVAKTQQQEMDATTARMGQLVQQIEALTQQLSQQQQATEQQLDVLGSKVKELQPPSPLEQLRSMASISGGQSMDEYFNELLARAGDDRRIGVPEMYRGLDENGAKDRYYVHTDKVPKLGDQQVKKSLGLG